MKELDALLNIINDPKKFEAKIKQLQKIEADTAKNLALIGKVKEIEPLHEKAKKEYAEALELQETARAEAQELVLNAEEWAAKERATVERQGLELKNQRESFLASKEAIEKELTQRERAVKKRENEVKKEREQAEKLQTESAAMISALNKKRDTIEGVLGSLN